MMHSSIYHSLLAFAPILASASLLACNSSDGERFNEQKDSYIFSSTSTTITAFGASRIEDDSPFRCPSVSGMSSESNIAYFPVRANAPLPQFAVKTVPGVRADTQGGIGISMSDMPIGLLDIYFRCNSTSSERLTNACPAGYEIVEACSDASEAKKECVLIYEGTHRLVVSSQVTDEKNCFSEENNRDPYSAQSTPAVAYACDAFSPVELPAAYRGPVPNNDCCNVQDRSTLDFCLRPCGCRTLNVQVVAKESALAVTDPQNINFINILKIAVFSNVDGDFNMFKKLIDSISEHNVDLAISLGNLTSSGSVSQLSKMRKLIDDKFTFIDGMNEFTDCSNDGELVCCESAVDRTFVTCNALLDKIGFLAGLGEDEFESGSLAQYRNMFGPSNTSTVFGKVQLIMLDTADASLPASEFSWLKSVLRDQTVKKCSIPAPTDFEQWPTLAECGKSTCRECIGKEAYCIPPDVTRSDPSLGPQNCVCVPATSKICPYNQTCSVMDGTEGTCICTRDADCASGGTCVEGECRPPMRLVFSYTPVFDEFGTRNNAFSSTDDAASLMSLLTKSRVSAIFSGRVHDYAKYEMGGIPMYITGGASTMSSFSKYDNHWLLVTVPDAYSNPDPDKMTVEIVKF